ncbi:MAG TPA: PVC-type heme-binding CxxCH protein [Gemmataceae bacterium]|nr:PVC-type heme-binding CxxCH protein [Gemmataceae bacterium]
MRRLAIFLFAALPAAAFAQADAKVPDPDPELERKSFIVAPGFEVNLYAADPLLAKPIQMNFDPQGRLWVASSEVYPQIKPGQVANDKIIVLEDTDGDGKADKTTVFADGLLIPTGVEPGDGGAYVANSTELVHLSASRPGGKADKTRVVLSGFGTEDTHHIIHTFRWGPDGCLYVNQSIYIHSHIETPHGVKHLNGGGIWRFRPETMELDVFVRGFVNSWGHDFDRWGQSLITDGAYGEGVNHGVPGAYFVTAVGATRIIKGLNPGSPKHCGLEILSGRHLPDDWQGDVITNDFRGHRVCRFKMGEDGSTFTSREMTEVIKTNHPAFRPIDVKMGPDGAIYIADWYNPIIQHGEVDFRDPRRDHVHGRIWRVTAKGRQLVKKPDLVGAKTSDLLDRLKDPEDWTRLNAKRVVKERGAKEVIPALEAWVKGLDPKDAGYEHHLLEALWTYESLDTVEPILLNTLLNTRDYRARAAAVRVLSHWHSRIPNAIDLLAVRAQDDSPRVRMEAVRALAATDSAAAVAPAFAATDKPVDRTMDYALWLTARDLEPAWMPKFKAGEDVFRGNVRGLAFALEAVGTRDVAKPLRALLESKKLPKERESAVWALLARVGGKEDLVYVLNKGVFAIDTDAHRNAVVPAMEENARRNRIMLQESDGANFEMLWGLYPMSSIDAANSALRLIGFWKAERFKAVLVHQAKDGIRSAFEGLALWGDAASRKLLEDLAQPMQTLAIRSQAVIALIQLDAVAAAAKAAELLADAKPAVEFADVFQAFLSQKGGANALAKALDSKKLNPDVAKLGLKAVRSSVQDAKPLTDALTKAGGLTAARTDYTPAEIKAYVDEVLTKGDAARGELVYRRKDATCLACHAIAGAGGQVGPDMTSIGASAQVDYLVESILIPNKAVKEGYHALRVTTLDNKVFVGIKTREADGKLYLRDSEDKEIAIPEKDIDEKTQSRSLMPDGLADQMTRQEFVDLVRFLSELGKVGPYAPNKARFVRRWQVIEPSRDNIFKIQRARAAAVVETPDAFTWTSTYSKASGEFPLDSLPKLVVWQGSEPFGLLRGQLDVTTGGPVKLKINGTGGLTLWVGSTPVEVKDETVLDLKPGLQTLTFAIDLNKRKDGLRVELEDVAGSPARVNIVNGK